MKRSFLFAAVALFLLPIALRGLWFYKGLYQSSGFPELPEFSEILPPTLPAALPETPEPKLDEGSEREGDPNKLEAGPVILFDLAHDNHFDLAEIESFTGQIQDLGGQVESVSSLYSSESLTEKLRRAAAYVVIAPNQPFDSFDIYEIDRFVQSGGRLLVIVDPTRRGPSSDYYSYSYDLGGTSLSIANELLEPFQIRFMDDYLYNILDNEGNFRNVFLQPADEDLLVEGITELVFYAAHSIQSVDGASLFTSGPETRSSSSDQAGSYASVVLAHSGNLLTLGDLTFMTLPYSQVADNSAFIENLAAFLVSGQRSWQIEDFPFFFGPTVELFTPEDVALEADTLAFFEKLQRSLAIHGKELLLKSDTEQVSDHLRLIYTFADDDSASLLEPLGIVLPGDSEEGLLEIPGLGELSPSGLGLIVLPPMEEGVELILLAEDLDGLEILVTMLSESSFFDCLRGDSILLCKVGESFDFGFEEGFFFEDFGSEAFPNELLTPEPGEGGP